MNLGNFPLGKRELSRILFSLENYYKSKASKVRVPLLFVTNAGFVKIRIWKQAPHTNDTASWMRILCSNRHVQLAPDQGLQPADQPTDMRRRCEEEAQEIVRLANCSTGQPCVENENLTNLISKLTAILLQIKVCFAENNSLILTPTWTLLVCC